MAEERETYNPIAFDALAEGIFANGKSADDIRSGLLTAYNSYDWSDDDKVKESLEAYGRDAGYLYRDQSLYPNIGEIAPVTFQDVIDANTREVEKEDGSVEKVTDISGDMDLYNKWEEENLKVISESKIPELLINKKGYEDSVKAFASQKRQETQQQVYKNLSTPGKFAYGVAEQFANIGLSAARPFAPVINAGVNVFTDNFDLNKFTNELIDPEWAKGWTYQIQGGIAQGATSALVAATGGVPALAAYQAPGAIGEVVNRFSETKRQTGDVGEARTAAAIEAGSQVLQFAGERLGVGAAGEALASGIKKPLAKAITSTAFAEGTTEAAGQAISNVAENIQTGRPSFEDVGRNVGKAGIIGGIAGGAVGGVAQVEANAQPVKVPGKDTSPVRAQELNDYGVPITPVTKQSVGPTASRVTENPDNGEVIQDFQVREDGSIEVVSVPVEEKSTPVFELEDGSIAAQSEDGLIRRVRPDGTTEEAFTDNLYIDEQTAFEISSKISSGEAQLVFDENEDPVLKSTDGTDTIIKKITASDVPAEGMYWVPASKPVNPNKQEVVHQANPIPSKIRTVSLDRSVGAAGQATQEQQISRFGERLYKTLEENPEALSPSFQALAQKGLYNTRLSGDELDTELRQYGDFFGLANWFMSTPANTTSPVESRAIGHLYNQFTAMENAALETGDTDTLEKLGQIFAPVFEHAAQKEAAAGQAVVFLKGKKDLARVGNAGRAYRNAANEAFQEEAAVEGLNPEEVRQPEIIDAEIANQQRAIAAEDSEVDAPLAQEQAAYEEEVAALENEGQDVADQINTTVDEDITNLEDSIVTSERKLERKKAKDIEKVEQAIAEDSQKLMELTADAQEIKDLTSEQIEQLDTQRNEQLANAEKTANTELKQVARETRTQAKQQKVLETKTLEQRYAQAKAKADIVHDKVKRTIVRLKLKRSSLSEAEQVDIDKRIIEEEAKVIRARTREAELKSSLDSIKSIPEIDAETEAILQELESGVTISQVPVGKKRKVTVASKKSGLDLAKLFNKSNGSALSALSGLSAVVNNLASTVSKSSKIKESANAQLQALEKRINDNKQLVRNARQSRAGTRVEQSQIDRARARLKSLRERAPATAESVLPANKRKKLELYKTRVNELKAKRATKVSDATRQQRQDKVAALERKKAKALAANKRAKTKAVAAAKVEAQNEQAIEKIQNAINDIIDSGTKRRLQRQLEIRKAASKGGTIPTKRLMEGAFVNNLIGNFTNIGPALMNLAAMVPTRAAALGVVDAYNFVKKFGTGRDYQSTLLPFVGELFSKGNAKKALTLAKANLKGERTGIPFDDSELAVPVPFVSTSKKGATGDLLNDLQVIRESDWLNITKALSFESIAANDKLGEKMGKYGRNAYLALSKLSGRIAGPIVRLIPALEAMNSVSLTSAFQAAAAAYYHNKTLDDAAIKNELYDVDGKIKPITAARLQEFIYNSKENRAKAEAAAAEHANKLREVGVDFTDSQQRVLEEEIYQNLPSRIHHGRDAIKQVGQINLNTPAQGVVGVVVQGVNMFVQSLADKGTIGYSTRFLVPFANSIGNMASMAIEMTPLGLGVGFQTKGFNRTPFERDIAVATSIVGSSVVAGLAIALTAELEKPEEERFFDIIGINYSSSAQKRAAFKNSGGLTNSIRIGNAYIPYPETALALIFGALGGYADRYRDGKDADAGMTGALTYAAFDAMKSLSRISMVKGLTDMYDTIQNGTKDYEGAALAVQRTLLNIAKPIIIPGLGALRTVSKYTDNPVDGWKDIKSAIVEGLPFVQGSLGEPALNVFGETIAPLGEDFGSGLHRIFSTRSQDLDIRWLVDRGYQIPTINDIKLDENEKKYAKDKTLEELEHPAKREILKEAGPQIREIVRNFRDSYGYSARSDNVQKLLSKQVNKALSRATVNYLQK